MRKREVDNFNVDIVLGTISIILSVIAMILLSSIFEVGGVGSNTLLHGLLSTVGVFAYATPILLLYSAYMLWRGKGISLRPMILLGSLIALISAFGILGLINKTLSGTLGELISTPLSTVLGNAPALLTLIGSAYVGAMLATGRRNVLGLSVGNPFEETNFTVRAYNGFVNFINSLLNIFSFDGLDISKKRSLIVKEELTGDSDDSQDNNSEDVEQEYVAEEVDIRKQILKTTDRKVNTDEDNKEGLVVNKNKYIYVDLEFVAPPLDLLNIDAGRSSGGDTKSKGKTIQNTLAEFGIPVEIAGVTVGPTVTQFRVKTPQGFKVKSIMNYHDNIQMNLAAESIHIDAPIPGQSVVGIDVPNKDKQTLGLGTLLDTPEFKNSGNLTVAIGKDIVGKPIYGDIESMPHLLIAGATKSGKSVTIQNIITSLLYKNSPENLKLIIIDPKKVEFTVYKNLPHLYTPVITDAKNAIKCLSWAVQEMDRRYDYFADNYEGIQNITDYNNKILHPAIEKENRKKNPNYDDLPEKFPFVVIIFDEFNDFMLNYGKEITSLITSLTQKARAAGMHLILATQRPDVKVINGTIKANIPARIALRTSSRIDSQTILDQGGAEDLLGNGDMLFLNPGKRPLRVQAPFVSSDEVKGVIRYIKDRYYGYTPPIIDFSKTRDSVSGEVSVVGNNYSENSGDDEEEQLYNNAKEYIIMTGRASATNLQSKFGLGFAKANRMIMMLEERGVVSALEGNKRRVLASRDEVNTSVEDLF